MQKQERFSSAFSCVIHFNTVEVDAFSGAVLLACCGLTASACFPLKPALSWNHGTKT
jgi:hypothetical protein